MADQSNTEQEKHKVRFPWNEKLAKEPMNHYNPIKPFELPKKKIIQEF